LTGRDVPSKPEQEEGSSATTAGTVRSLLAHRHRHRGRLRLRLAEACRSRGCWAPASSPPSPPSSACAIGMRVRLRQGMIIVLGVLLGSGFTPELAAAGLPNGRASLCRPHRHDHDRRGTLCYALAAHALPTGTRPTCYFAAMPGGLNDMTIMGGAMGGEERAIALAHALRILTVVLTIPVWYRLGERRADQRAHHRARTRPATTGRTTPS
jgi:hypothetical protein